ncbi:MAG: hypothetical protein ABI970_20955 [Chloroflexota bacterium]
MSLNMQMAETPNGSGMPPPPMDRTYACNLKLASCNWQIAAVVTAERSAAFVSFQRHRPSLPPT